MKYIKLCTIIIVLITFIIPLAYAQNGTLRGTVYDASIGEVVSFSNIFVKETASGTNSDLDGAYSLSLPPGVFTVEFSYIGLSTLTVTDVRIVADEITVIDAHLETGSLNLDEIIVTATVAQNSDAVLNTLKRNSPNLLDGVPAQSIQRAGDSDAGAAIKRVTGVSVEGGKNVYVRGLGDRYTKTTLNGMEIPGLDPDKNSVQVDIFPTSLIDNIIVYKTFTPNLPGDFTGGMVDIITKDFPESKKTNLTLGLGINPHMHFNDRYLTYPGGGRDLLGMDDNTRRLPITSVLNPPSVIENDLTLTRMTSAFQPNLAAMRANSSPDYSFGLGLGNQFELFNLSVGYNFSINYKNSTEFYNNVEFNEYEKDRRDITNTQLVLNRGAAGEMGINDVLWSGLAGLSIKTNTLKIGLSAFRSQNGTKKAAIINQSELEDNPFAIKRDNLEYAQREVTNFLLSTKYSPKTKGLDIEFRLSPTFTDVTEPDLRQTPFEILPESEGGGFSLDRSIGAIPSRSWRYLTEYNLSSRLDVTKTIDIANKESKIKAGVSFNYKSRDYQILNYLFPVQQEFLFEYSGDPDQILREEFIWTRESRAGIFVEGNKEPANEFNADQSVHAAYLMHQMPISSRLKLIYGLRVENVNINFSGQNNLGDLILTDSTVLDEFNVLPSVNIVYSLSEEMNLRGSFSRTLARPTFKEKSLVQIQDMVSGRTFLGNINLKQTNINNFDLRLEKFFSGTDLVSVSLFYKSFNNPIELVAFADFAPDNYTPRNMESARVQGIEVEARKKLTSTFSVATNFTYVDAQTRMSEEELTSRQETARPGEEVDDQRAMVGQSPYIINTSLIYHHSAYGLEANIAYNVQGKRLSIAGIGIVPDVYEQPFNSLNAKISKNINSVFKVSVAVNNLLNASRKREYEAFGANNQTFDIYNPNRSFAFSLGITF